MWLPKDERRLLKGYFTLVGDIEKFHVYEEADLVRLLSWKSKPELIKEYGKSGSFSQDNNTDDSFDIDAFKADVQQTIRGIERVKKANRLLESRELVKTKRHNSLEDVVLVSLTTKGLDLGRSYNNLLLWSGLWFGAYKKHWLIASVLALLAVLVAWLKSKF